MKSKSNSTGGQKEGEHGVVQYVQYVKNYQRNVLRVFVVVSGPVGNPESSTVHRKSAKSVNQIPHFRACPCWMLVLFSFLQLSTSLHTIEVNCVNILTANKKKT